MGIQVPPDSTGKIVETITLTDHRQVIVLGGDTTIAEKASVKNATVAENSTPSYGLFTRSIPRRYGEVLTTTPLGISGVFTLGARDGNNDGNTYVVAVARADVASAASGFVIEEYNGANDDFADANFIRTVASATVSANTTTYLHGMIRGRKWRVKYTNGGTGQTSFKLTAAASSIPVFTVDSSGRQIVVSPVAADFLVTIGAALPAGSNNIGDVDVLTLPAGTVAGSASLPAGTNNIGDVDVLTVPSPLSTTGGGTEATAHRVTIANDSTGVLSVDDNGGSLTVDGTVAVSTAFALETTQGSVLTSVQLIDDTVHATNAALGKATAIAGQLDDTTTTAATEDSVAPIRITPQRAVHANLRNQAGTEVGTAAAPVRTDPTGTTTQPVSDAAGSLTVDAPVGTPVAVRQSDGTAFIDPRSGDVASDAVDSGNPVKIGGRAQLNEPTVVSADGDRVNAWFDLFGRLVVLPGHANPEPPVAANGSAAGVSVIAAPGASLSLYICKGSLHNSAATEAVVSLRDGAAGTIRFTANLAADGGGTLFDFGARGWKLTANTALVMDAVSATQYCNVTEYYIAP